MNDAQRLEAMDSYFGRYRKMMRKLEATDQEQDDVRKAYEQRRMELAEERTRITRELTNMRQVITKMIDEGCDPVMAGLKMDEDEQISSIWQQRDADSFTMEQDDIMNRVGSLPRLTTADISTLSMGQLSWPGATGATGAIGAAGSISMGPNGGYQQGYGAIPPISNHPGVTADMRGFVDGHGDYHEYAWTGTAEL
jgi:hypothetical protein